MPIEAAGGAGGVLDLPRGAPCGVPESSEALGDLRRLRGGVGSHGAAPHGDALAPGGLVRVLVLSSRRPSLPEQGCASRVEALIHAWWN